MSSVQEFSSEMGFDAVIWSNTRLLVEWDNSLPGAALVDFAPLGSVALASAVVSSEGRLEPMKTESQRTCPSCGSELSGATEFCPVCLLRKALAGGVESGESSASEEAVKPTSDQSAQRFEHYELVTGKDGKPIELGRGAMGVTYKALDVDLRCPVTLKVISERYLGDESARLRFLREARAAASVRHPNVASVFHLGRTGQNYFYAMEFVEGETLENLIKRCRPAGGKAGARNCERRSLPDWPQFTNRTLSTEISSQQTSW